MTRRELLPGEALLLHERCHWVLVGRPALRGAALLAATVGLTLRLGLPGPWIAALLYGALVLAGAFVLRAWAKWLALEFALTDQRVILRQGVFGRRTKVIALERVQDVSTRASLLGRLLGYGSLEIDAAGRDGSQVLAPMPAPERLRDRVFAQTQARHGSPEQGEL